MNSKGFSVLEMLLLLMLGAIVLSLSGEALLSVYKTQQYNQVYTHLLSQAQFTKQILRNSIKMAGFIGCRRLENTKINYIEAPSQSVITLANSLKVTEKKGAPVIHVKKLSPQLLTIQKIYAHQIVLSGLTPAFKAGDAVLLTDCRTTFITKVQAVKVSHWHQQQTIRLSPTVMRQLTPDFIAGRLQQIKLYLSRSRISSGKALFRQTNEGDKKELVNSVMSIKVRGVVLNKNKLSVLPAKQIKHWQQVKALAIQLLLRSTEKVNKHYVVQSFPFLVILKERQNHV